MSVTSEKYLRTEHILGLIAKEQYYQFPGTTATVCCLTLVNGFTVIGESACISPSFFDEQIGKDVAKANAVAKIWQVEGYLFKERDYLSGAYGASGCGCGCEANSCSSGCDCEEAKS